MNAVVVRKGDEDAGDIVIKVNLMSFGFRVYFQVRDAVSELAWLCATGNDPVPESAADLAIAKAVDRDWDVWVLEIEDELGAASVLDNVVKG